MSKKAIRVFSREFKLKIVRRMLAGENVSALARELKVLRKDLYVWRKRFRSGGPEALRGRGRPPKAGSAIVARSMTAKQAASPVDGTRKRIAELERCDLRRHRSDDDLPAARRTHNRTDVCADRRQSSRLLPCLGSVGPAGGRDRRA